MKKLLGTIFMLWCIMIWSAYAQIDSTWNKQYQEAKVEISSVLPVDISKEVDKKFAEFESIDSLTSISGDEKRKILLQDIIEIIRPNLSTEGEEIQENQIDILDMNDIIMPNICKIIAAYNMDSETCHYTE